MPRTYRITATVTLDDGTVYDVRMTSARDGQVKSNGALLAGLTGVAHVHRQAVVDALRPLFD